MIITVHYRSPECVNVLFPVLDSKVLIQSGFELFKFAEYKAGDRKHSSESLLIYNVLSFVSFDNFNDDLWGQFI